MAPPRSKKRQTKLSFSPSTGSRYANVTFTGSPAKKRKVNGQQSVDDLLRSDEVTGSSSAIAAAAPSTPLRSSLPTESFGKVYDSDEEPGGDGRALTDSDSGDVAVNITSSRRSRRGEPTSTNIFTRAPIISPKPMKTAKPRKGKTKDKGKGRESAAMIHSDSDEDNDKEENVGPQKGKKSTKSTKRANALQKPRQTQVQVISSDEEEQASAQSEEDYNSDIKEVDKPTPRQRLTSRSSAAQPDSSDSEDDVRPAASQRKRTAIVESDSMSDVAPSPRKRQILSKQAPTPSNSQSPVIELGSEASDDDDDDDDEQPVNTPSRRLTRSRPGQKRQSPGSDDGDDSDDVVPTRTPRRTPRQRHQEEDEDEDGSEEDETPAKTPSRRKLKQRARRGSSEADSEDAEVAAEAQDLKKSTVFHKHKGGRLRDRAGNNKVNDRRSRLEQLKAQREGRTIEVSSDEDEDEAEEEDSLAEDEDIEADESFVIDDDEEARNRDGAETSADWLPLEMMRHGQRGLKEHFKYVVKGIITQRLNPAEAKEVQELYKMSLKRVNREAEGLTDRLVSSAWVETFIRVLKARPDYEEYEIGGMEKLFEKCSACNRSGHAPSFMIKLKGRAYRREDLDPLKDDDEDDSDAADETSEDEEGHKLIDEDRDWPLGTFCRSNAMNAHSLIHWRHHLNHWLNSYMEGRGLFSGDEIVRRDSWSAKRRGKLVEGIMDELESSGQIKALWTDLKNKLNAAPEIQGQRWGR